MSRMRRSLLLTSALLALAFSQAMPPISISTLHPSKAPPNPRALFPRIKNRREKFRPPKIIGKNNMKRGRR